MEIIHTKTSKQKIRIPRKNFETIIVMPAIDIEQADRVAFVMKQRTAIDALLIITEDDARIGFIAATNYIYKNTQSIFYGYVAQDAFPGYFWLDYALESLNKSKANLLSFNDGRFFGKIAVFGIARRAWTSQLYDDNFFFPGYRSHFADTELSSIALAKNTMVFNPNALLVEVDYEKHLHSNNVEDEKLYRERAKTGFGGLIQPFIPH